MAIVNSRLGKCSNFGNCSIADGRATVEVGHGVDFVCTECGKPLLPVDSGEAAGGRKMWGVGALVAVLVVAGAAWFLSRDKASPPAEVPAAAPTTAPVVVKPAEPARPAMPVTGDCSEADQRAGLCIRAR